MNRRDFLKSISAYSLARYTIPTLTLGGYAKHSFAMGPNYNDVNLVAPSIMPQVINIFLYGGPSELAGNLTNIGDIELNSQNSYAQRLGGGILRLANDGNGQITQNGFWREAGGAQMEAMLAAGDMSVYRTILKTKNPTRSHRESIFMAHKGTLDIENTPGVGTRLAAMLYTHRDVLSASSKLADGTALSSMSNGILDLALPFVSFEGETTSYSLDLDFTLPLQFKGLTLDTNFDNPYSRRVSNSTTETELNSLINQVVDEQQQTRFSKSAQSLELRETMDDLIGALQTSVSAALPDDPDNPGNQLVYPCLLYTSDAADD